VIVLIALESGSRGRCCIITEKLRKISYLHFSGKIRNFSKIKHLSELCNNAVPRFQLHATYQLASTLAALGMPEAFQPGGFTGMSESPHARWLALSAIVHGACVEVTEEGTTAAAATALTMVALTSAVIKPPPPTFRADHPFVFLIRENQTGAIVFMGRVMRPPPDVAHS
jgi:serpin B